MPTEPHWKLTVAGALAIVTMTIGGWSHVAGKADKGEVYKVTERVNLLDKNQALDSQNQVAMLKLLEKIDAKMEKLDKAQQETLWEIIKNRDPVGPRNQLPPSPNPLNR